MPHMLLGKYKNKYIGTIGDVGILVFTQKSFHVLGDGGLIITNNTNLYKRYYY